MFPNLLGLIQAFTAGHFEMALDGGMMTAFVKSVEGGYAKNNVLADPIGGSHLRVKGPSTTENEPISAEVGMSGCRDVIKWLEASWMPKTGRQMRIRRNGMIMHGNFNHVGQYMYGFTDALLLEAGFPALDAMSKEPAYLKLKFQPEAYVTSPAKAMPLMGLVDPRQKLWSTKRFTLALDGMLMGGVSKIDAFTIKQGVKPFYTGRERLPELVPTKLEFPDLTVTMNVGPASSIVENWYKQSVLVKGARKNLKGMPPRDERNGELIYLGPAGMPLFSINLHEIGIKSFTLVRSEAHSDLVKKCKFELYVGSMTIGKVSAGM